MCCFRNEGKVDQEGDDNQWIENPVGVEFVE